MSGYRLIIPTVVLASALSLVPAAMAQVGNLEDSILDLTPIVLDLTATVQDMKSNSVDVSADVRDKLARSGDIEVRLVGDDVILSVASDVLFDFDSAELSNKAQRSLTDVAEVLSDAPDGQITVVGHTDAKGADVYNLELSERRAMAVASYLKDHSVPDDRLSIEGRGEAEPIADNMIDGKDNPEGRAKNRRVEFVMPKSMLSD